MSVGTCDQTHCACLHHLCRSSFVDGLCTRDTDANDSISPALAVKQTESQHSWFVQENAKLKSQKFAEWVDSGDDGKKFYDVALQHLAAEDQLRVRQVSVQRSHSAFASMALDVAIISETQVTVKRESAQVPLCVQLDHIGIVQQFQSLKKNYFKVENCYQVRMHGLLHRRLAKRGYFLYDTVLFVDMNTGGQRWH